MDFSDITDYRHGYRKGWTGQPAPDPSEERWSEWSDDGYRDGKFDQDNGLSFGESALDEAKLG